MGLIVSNSYALQGKVTPHEPNPCVYAFQGPQQAEPPTQLGQDTLTHTYTLMHPNASPNQFIKRSLMYRRSMKLRGSLGG